MAELKEYKIKDLGLVITGKTPSGNCPEDFGFDMPFVTPTDYKNYRKWANDAERKLSQTGVDKLQSKVLPVNSVLVTCIGSDMGKVVLNSVAVITNQQINAVVPNTGLVNPDFLYYKLVDNYELLRMFGQAGTAVPIVNKGDFEEITFEYPSLPEQDAIAEVLSSLDNKVDLLYRQNKTLEALAETLFRQWFIEEAEESWERKSLSEIATYLNGLALQNYRSNRNDSLPVIKIREMNQGITESTDRCSRDIPKQYIIQDGDVLFSWSGSLEVVIWHDGEGALNQHLFKVTSERYPKWFYYLATQHHLETFRAIAESKSTTMGHIQRHHLSEALIAIPGDDLFTRYDETLSLLIEKLIQNNAQIKTLTRQRDSLLPKLMSGSEVRVTV